MLLQPSPRERLPVWAWGTLRFEADDFGVPPPLTVLLALLPMLLPPPVFPVSEPRGLLPKGDVMALLFPSWLPPLLPVLLPAAALPPAAFPCPIMFLALLLATTLPAPLLTMEQVSSFAV